MNRIERKVLFRSLLLGAAVTAAVVVVQAGQWLAPLERLAYDARVEHAQFFMRPPTDRLIHLDINDATLETIGRWPWDRSVLAGIVDETRRAGAKVVALDLLLVEPSEQRLVEVEGQIHRVDDDVVLAEAMERAGKVLLPIAGEIRSPRTPLEQRLYDVLREDLELEPEEAFRRAGAGPAAMGDHLDLFVSARRSAMYDRLEARLDEGVDQPEALARDLLPAQVSRGVTGSPQSRLLGRQLRRVRGSWRCVRWPVRRGRRRPTRFRWKTCWRHRRN